MKAEEESNVRSELFHLQPHSPPSTHPLTNTSVRHGRCVRVTVPLAAAKGISR